MTTRGLYKAADGSWQQADARAGFRLLYTLKQAERWALLDNDCVLVVHPDRPPKVVYPDGRVEGIAPSGRANAISAKTTTSRGDPPNAGEPEQSTAT
jgi:hypothetical protein